MEYYHVYDCSGYFSGKCSAKRCRYSKSGQAWTDFCHYNAKVCKSSDPLIEIRSEEHKDVDESF